MSIHPNRHGAGISVPPFGLPVSNEKKLWVAPEPSETFEERSTRLMDALTTPAARAAMDKVGVAKIYRRKR